MMYESFYEKCVHMDKITIPDGSGGYITTWVEGAEFNAAIVTQASTEQRIAEQQIGSTVYKITAPKSVSFEYHDVIKRKKDNKVFRITSDSDDVQSPKIATMQFVQVTAEEWKIPS